MYKILITILISAFVLVGCNDKKEVEETKQGTETENSAATKIKVVEHINAAGYTYILADEDGKEYWIAVSQMPVETGEVLYYTQHMEMKDFKSKALGKTFESIYFVEGVSKDGKNPVGKGNAMMRSAPHSGTPKVKQANVKVDPVEGGITVEEIYSKKDKYEGKTVIIKGVVTKYNAGILNRNWIHIQDGTSHDIYKDITVTSSQEAKVGETIVIEGKLILNKDFGSGYKYDCLIEEAKIVSK